MTYTLTCQHCGGPFERSRADAATCSAKCRQARARAFHRATNEPPRPGSTTRLPIGNDLNGAYIPGQMEAYVAKLAEQPLGQTAEQPAGPKATRRRRPKQAKPAPKRQRAHPKGSKKGKVKAQRKGRSAV